MFYKLANKTQGDGRFSCANKLESKSVVIEKAGAPSDAPTALY